MFDALQAEVDAVEIPLERDAIVSAFRLRDRFDGKLATAVGGYEAAGLHDIDGSVTMAAWLRHRAGFDSPAVTKTAQRSAKLNRLPVLRDAYCDGLLTAGAVDVILGQLVTRHLARFAEHEGELIPILAGLDIDGVTRAMRDWRAKADALDPGPAPAELPDTVHLSQTLDDRGAMNASLSSDLFGERASVLRYGRSTRDWPVELVNAIAIRDGGCRWPGCTAPVHWCDVHHVQEWEHGGPTDIDNGVLLCRRHHRKLHAKAGFSLKLLPDATVELTLPDGTTETSHPRGLDPPRLPLPSW